MNRRTVLRLGAKVLLGGVATRALSGCSSTEPPSAPNNPLNSALRTGASRTLATLSKPVRKTDIKRTTFAVDTVTVATTPLPTLPFKEGIFRKLNAEQRPLESWLQGSENLVAQIAMARDLHPLLLTTHLAFAEHRPLVLSPDMIWLVLLQGLAMHINANPEKLRRKFVVHDDKKVIDISLPATFVKGNPDNDWEWLLSEFSTQLRGYIGATTHDLIVSEFSTTGSIERAAMEVTLMDGLQSYFVYAATVSCGIPNITLEGTPEDWRLLRTRAQQLQQFDLDWWIPTTLPVLDAFVEASSGTVDTNFWCSFYKLKPFGCGSEYIHGHILNLFPYFGKKRPSDDQLLRDFEQYVRQSGHYPGITEQGIQQELETFRAKLKREGPPAGVDTLRRNPFLGRKDLSDSEGMVLSDVETVLSSAPFIWNIFDTEYQMEFLAGFVGATQDAKTLALRPHIGWAVRDGHA